MVIKCILQCNYRWATAITVFIIWCTLYNVLILFLKKVFLWYTLLYIVSVTVEKPLKIVKFWSRKFSFKPDQEEGVHSLLTDLPEKRGSSTKTSYFVRSTLSETKSGPSNRLKGLSKLWFRSWLPDDSQDFLQKLFSLDISCSLSGQRTRRTKSMLGSSGILHRPLCFLGYQQYHGKGGESLPPNEKQGGEETDLDDEIFIWAPFFFGRDSPVILTPIIGHIFRRPAWLEISAILALALLSNLMTIWWGLTKTGSPRGEGRGGLTHAKIFSGGFDI